MEKIENAVERNPKEQRLETRIPDELLEKKDLSLNAKVVLAKILGLWKSTKHVFISNERLAQLLGSVSTDTVKRAKRELTNLGLIKITQEEKGKGHLANTQVMESKVNDYLGFKYFKVPCDCLARWHKLPDLLLFKDEKFAKQAISWLAGECGGRDKIPQHFLDEIKTLQDKAMKEKLTYDEYKLAHSETNKQ